MTTTPDFSFIKVLEWIFPHDLLEVFTVTDIKTIKNARTDDETIQITLEEKNVPPAIPEEYRGKNITSKGFKHPLTIQDFPLRDRLCMFKIKRRRWEIDGVGSLSRELSCLPASGLKLTTEFALFLKETDRTRAGGSRTHRETIRSEEVEKNVS
jgi:hypothetical protein